MELEFDKEIDAILAKAGQGNWAAHRAGELTHPDADAIAAFAENALPATARTAYVEHFAACDGCRRLLSQSILFTSQIDEPVPAAVSMPINADILPWYQSLFRPRRLAMAMGGLVLIFGGILGFLVLQNSDDARRSTISQVTDAEPSKGGPNFDEMSANSAAEVETAVPETPSISASNTNAAPESLSPNRPAVAKDQTGLTAGRASAKAECLDCDGVTANAAPAKEKTVTAAAPPSAPKAIDSTGLRRDEQKLSNDNRDVIKKSPAEKQSAGSSEMRDDSLNQRNVANLPLLTPNPSLLSAGDSKTVDGKTFVLRDGAWYDQAYKNQETFNYRRGTEEYKKLDSRIRRITDKIGGTVILMWQEKAYRIQ